jgi:hypothetical protein
MKQRFPLISLLLLAACSSPGEAPEVSSWGALKSVLREGQTQGRVELSEAEVPGTWGIGAVEGLGGEVLVEDGTVWVSRAASPEAVGPAEQPEPGEQATLLSLSRVQGWSETTLPAVGDMSELEAQLKAAAVAQGLDSSRPFFFVLEGTAAALELHVLNGACPFASPPPAPERMPYRAALDSTPVLLVGVYAEGAAGVLTHHGSSCHVHVLTRGALPTVGHVDGLRLLAGAELRIAVR